MSLHHKLAIVLSRAPRPPRDGTIETMTDDGTHNTGDVRSIGYNFTHPSEERSGWDTTLSPFNRSCYIGANKQPPDFYLGDGGSID